MKLLKRLEVDRSTKSKTMRVVKVTKTKEMIKFSLMMTTLELNLFLKREEYKLTTIV